MAPPSHSRRDAEVMHWRFMRVITSILECDRAAKRRFGPEPTPEQYSEVPHDPVVDEYFGNGFSELARQLEEALRARTNEVLTPHLRLQLAVWDAQGRVLDLQRRAGEQRAGELAPVQTAGAATARMHSTRQHILQQPDAPQRYHTQPQDHVSPEHQATTANAVGRRRRSSPTPGFGGRATVQPDSVPDLHTPRTDRVAYQPVPAFRQLQDYHSLAPSPRNNATVNVTVDDTAVNTVARPRPGSNSTSSVRASLSVADGAANGPGHGRVAYHALNSDGQQLRASTALQQQQQPGVQLQDISGNQVLNDVVNNSHEEAGQPKEQHHQFGQTMQPSNATSNAHSRNADPVTTGPPAQSQQLSGDEVPSPASWALAQLHGPARPRELSEVEHKQWWEDAQAEINQGLSIYLPSSRDVDTVDRSDPRPLLPRDIFFFRHLPECERYIVYHWFWQQLKKLVEGPNIGGQKVQLTSGAMQQYQLCSRYITDMELTWYSCQNTTSLADAKREQNQRYSLEDLHLQLPIIQEPSFVCAGMKDCRWPTLRPVDEAWLWELEQAEHSPSRTQRSRPGRDHPFVESDLPASQRQNQTQLLGQGPGITSLQDASAYPQPSQGDFRVATQASLDNADVSVQASGPATHASHQDAANVAGQGFGSMTDTIEISRTYMEALCSAGGDGGTFRSLSPYTAARAEYVEPPAYRGVDGRGAQPVPARGLPTTAPPQGVKRGYYNEVDKSPEKRPGLSWPSPARSIGQLNAPPELSNPRPSQKLFENSPAYVAFTRLSEDQKFTKAGIDRSMRAQYKSIGVDRNTGKTFFATKDFELWVPTADGRREAAERDESRKKVARSTQGREEAAQHEVPEKVVLGINIDLDSYLIPGLKGRFFCNHSPAERITSAKKCCGKTCMTYNGVRVNDAAGRR